MSRYTIVAALLLFLTGCAYQNYNKEIPVHTLSIGMNKDEVIAKLGQPHRVVSSEIVNGANRQIWMYQQDKQVWLSGNSFLGGTTRNDQIIYLVYIENDKLVGWKDNQLQKSVKPDNTFEIRSN